MTTAITTMTMTAMTTMTMTTMTMTMTTLLLYMTLGLSVGLNNCLTVCTIDELFHGLLMSFVFGFAYQLSIVVLVVGDCLT